MFKSVEIFNLNNFTAFRSVRENYRESIITALKHLILSYAIASLLISLIF